MAVGAVAVGRESELSGPLLRELDQLFYVAHRQRGIGNEHARKARDFGDRGEVGDRIVRELALNVRNDRVGADRPHHHRVSVGRRARDELAAENASGAAAVVDEHGLAPRFAQPLSELAPDHVGRSACGKRDDDAHRLHGKSFAGERGGAREDRRGEERHEGAAETRRRAQSDPYPSQPSS
jgi:hypothetical protein